MESPKISTVPAGPLGHTSPRRSANGPTTSPVTVHNG